MLRSWWKQTAILLTAVITAAALFCGWTGISYSRQLRQTIQEENANSAALWSGQTTYRLDTLYGHIYELLLTLYNNTELRTGSPIMDEWTKQKIVDMMEDKLLISDDADAFFVYDTQNEFFLFAMPSGNQARTNIDKLKQYMHDNAQLQAEPFRDLSWQVDTVGSRSYFLKSVLLGKYIVGAASDLSHYYIDTEFSVLGEDMTFGLLIEDTYFPCGGDGEQPWLDQSRITVSAPLGYVDGDALLSVRQDTLWDDTSWVGALMVLDSALCLVLVVVLLRLLRRKVAGPTRELIQANHALASGDTGYRLDAGRSGSAEFESLYDSFNEMAEQIVELRIQAYDLKLQEEQNKLTMLRAQIRPHSFLNAITTISNMTYNNKPEEIRGYISSFAKFIRYMLNVSASWITVEEELKQIENYLKMQQLRFPESVNFTVDCPEELGKRKIPFLILYTLAENSVKHAMTLYEPLNISVSCRAVETESFRGICLTQEDNGTGFPEEVLRAVEDGTWDLNAKEHIGLSNVRYTLHLVYQRKDLLRIANRPQGGAHVELWIPET